MVVSLKLSRLVIGFLPQAAQHCPARNPGHGKGACRSALISLAKCMNLTCRDCLMMKKLCGFGPASPYPHPLVLEVLSGRGKNLQRGGDARG